MACVLSNPDTSPVSPVYPDSADAIWYGPHQCACCGETIVRQAIEQGGIKLESYPSGPVYPNTKWVLHTCRAHKPRPAPTPEPR